MTHKDEININVVFFFLFTPILLMLLLPTRLTCKRIIIIIQNLNFSVSIFLSLSLTSHHFNSHSFYIEKIQITWMELLSFMLFYLSLYLSTCVNMLAYLLHWISKFYVIHSYRFLANPKDTHIHPFQDITFSFNMEANISASKTKTYYLSVSKKHSPQTPINTDLDLKLAPHILVALGCT